MSANMAQPGLLCASGSEELLARWSGDVQIDAALACTTAREAAARLFGPQRATRGVTRSLARSLLGPPRQPPGREAALAAVSLLLALDIAAETREQLVTDDLEAILASSGAPGAPIRRRLIQWPARELLAVLVEGWPRRRRRDLALEMIRDDSGRTDEALRRLRALSACPELVFPAPEPGLDGLLGHLRLIMVDEVLPAREDLLAGAAAFHDRPRIKLHDGFEVRVPISRAQLVAEGARFANCLASQAPAVAHHRRLIATVHRGLQPVAAVEVNGSGEIRQILGPANRPLGGTTQRDVEQRLLQAEVLHHFEVDRPRGPTEEVAARIACRAAVLLADDIEPHWDPLDPNAQEHGDAVLQLLGGRAALLSDTEGDALQHGSSPHDPEHEWEVIATMLLASHLEDPDVARLDGSPAFRRAVTDNAWQILGRTLQLPDRPPHPAMPTLIHDSALSPAGREGLREVLARWPWAR